MSIDTFYPVSEEELSFDEAKDILKNNEWPIMLRTPRGHRYFFSEPIDIISPENIKVSVNTDINKLQGNPSLIDLENTWRKFVSRTRLSKKSGNVTDYVAPIAFTVIPFNPNAALSWWTSRGGPFIYIPGLTLVQSNTRSTLIKIEKNVEPTSQKWGIKAYIEETNHVSTDFLTYAKALEQAKEYMHESELQKLVLARKKVIELNKVPKGPTIFKALCQTQPNTYAFTIGRNDYLFFGASPELILRARGRHLYSRPLAGSRGVSPVTDTHRAAKELRQSLKDKREHKYVTDWVSATFLSFGGLCVVPEPKVARFSSIMHLSTPIHAYLPNPIGILQVLNRLHPTPAIAGSPVEAASKLISQLETFSRGWYGGLVGIIDAKAQGEFALAIRCAKLEINIVSMYAGAGVLPESYAESEWDETSAKLRAVENAIYAAQNLQYVD